ncbi:hypothetical protein DFH11DRAFT_1742088 [Phellopilus nigrolimitatus]|nr:hypothetical protein DFH11DRAFT_1742088 [Phellopilus nigrolimitatus]
MSDSTASILNYNKFADLAGKVAPVTLYSYRFLDLFNDMYGCALAYCMARTQGPDDGQRVVFITGRCLNVLQEAAKLLQMNKISILSVADKLSGADEKFDIPQSMTKNRRPKMRKNYAEDAPSPANQTLGDYRRMVLICKTSIGGVLLRKRTKNQFAYMSLKAATSHLTQLILTELALRHGLDRARRLPIRAQSHAEKLDGYAKTPIAALEHILAIKSSKCIALLSSQRGFNV